MRGRIGVMVRLDLDNDAADAVDQEGRADQIGGDLMDAAVEERAFQRLAEGRGGRAAGFRALRHFEVGIGPERLRMLPQHGMFC